MENGRAAVKGHIGSVSFDGSVVRIEKKMRGEHAIPLSSIGAVSIVKAGVGMRAIRFSVSGGSTAKTSTFNSNHKDLATDPFALTFRKGSLAQFQAFVDEVHAAKAAT